MIAAQTGQPHWELTDEEAKAVTTAGLDVLSFYPVQASERSIAWGMLIYALGTVYGSRALSTMVLKRDARPATAVRSGEAPAASVGIGPVGPLAPEPPARPGANGSARTVEIAPGVFADQINA